MSRKDKNKNKNRNKYPNNCHLRVLIQQLSRKLTSSFKIIRFCCCHDDRPEPRVLTFIKVHVRSGCSEVFGRSSCQSEMCSEVEPQMRILWYSGRLKFVRRRLFKAQTQQLVHAVPAPPSCCPCAVKHAHSPNSTKIFKSQVKCFCFCCCCCCCFTIFNQHYSFQ